LVDVQRHDPRLTTGATCPVGRVAIRALDRGNRWPPVL